MQLSPTTLPLAKTLGYLRHALPLRGWERVFRFVFNPARQRPFEFPLRVPGGTVIADARSYLDRHALFYGSIEPDDVQNVRQILSSSKARTALDIGANVGHFALAMAEFSRVVHAFEPNPPVFSKLQTNLRANRLNIVAHPIGLSDQDAELRFVSVSETNSGQGNFSPDGDLKLPVKNGDAFLAANDIVDVDFVKIDVEGMERKVLAGLRNTIARDLPFILCEATGSPEDFAALLPREYQLFTTRSGVILSRHKRVPVGSTPLAGDNILCVPPRSC